MAFISPAQQKRFLRDTSPQEPFADQEFAFKIMLKVTNQMKVCGNGLVKKHVFVLWYKIKKIKQCI